MIGVMALLCVVFWALFIASIHFESPIFTFIASCGLILVSVYIMVNGLEDVNNFVTKGFAVIQIGVGLIGLFAPLLDEIES
jgi:hypothetical protein